MDFLKDMTFQYFFFDTYIGYFLQALPIALIVSIIYGLIKFRRDKNTPRSKKIVSCIFVCYITGLICLVLGLDLMHVFYYNLFYSFESGTSINWFRGEVDLIPDFYNNISREVIGNILMFLPFGILYPLSKEKIIFKETIIKGIILVVSIEVLQPIFGRSFDINDIILNSLGIIISTTIFILLKRILNIKHNKNYDTNKKI